MSSGQMLEEYHQMAVSFNLVCQRENLKFYRDLVSPQKKISVNLPFDPEDSD